MGSVKKGQLARPGEWAKHLNRVEPEFWHRERALQRLDIAERLDEDTTSSDIQCPICGLPDWLCDRYLRSAGATWDFRIDF